MKIINIEVMNNGFMLHELLLIEKSLQMLITYNDSKADTDIMKEWFDENHESKCDYEERMNAIILRNKVTDLITCEKLRLLEM